MFVGVPPTSGLQAVFSNRYLHPEEGATVFATVSRALFGKKKAVKLSEEPLPRRTSQIVYSNPSTTGGEPRRASLDVDR